MAYGRRQKQMRGIQGPYKRFFFAGEASFEGGQGTNWFSEVVLLNLERKA